MVYRLDVYNGLGTAEALPSATSCAAPADTDRSFPLQDGPALFSRRGGAARHSSTRASVQKADANLGRRALLDLQPAGAETEMKRISLEETKDALLRSGYLLEHRLETLLRQKDYYVETNEAYPDPETAKSRELDIYAIRA